MKQTNLHRYNNAHTNKVIKSNSLMEANNNIEEPSTNVVFIQPERKNIYDFINYLQNFDNINKKIKY